MLHASLNDTGVQLYQQMQARLKMLRTSTVCLISRTPDQDSFPKSSIMKGIMMREVLQDDNNYEDNCCDNDEGAEKERVLQVAAVFRESCRWRRVLMFNDTVP